MSGNHAGHAMHAVKHTAESLRPLHHGKQKNPALAALLAFLFGCFGLGIYLESFKEFFIGLAIIAILTIVIPGIGFFFALFILAFYAYSRAEASNKKLGYY